MSLATGTRLSNFVRIRKSGETTWTLESRVHPHQHFGSAERMVLTEDEAEALAEFLTSDEVSL